MPVKLTIGALQNVELDALLEYVSPKATEDNGVIMFEVKAAVKIPENVFVRAGYSANASIVSPGSYTHLSSPIRSGSGG